MTRESMHVEPVGATATARHYIRDIVYGANDGLITTFAVVGGVAGGALSSIAVIVIGAANLAADGVSMGVGNLLSIRADERARERPISRSSKPIRGSTEWRPRWPSWSRA
jgi:vacuolar iron transporter family protein